MNKVVTWLRVLLGTVIGLVQVGLKAVKEVLTGVINVLSLIVPAKKAQAIVVQIRTYVNVIDGKFEALKAEILKVITQA